MEKLRRKDLSPNSPPSWWHDAVRQNYEGNLYNNDKFVSYIIESEEEDFSCCFLSLTAPDFDKNLGPGIYLETDIPKSLREEAPSMLSEILRDFAGVLIRHQKEKLSGRQSRRRKIGTNGMTYGEETSVDGRLLSVGGKITVNLFPFEGPVMPKQSEGEILLDKQVAEIFAPRNEVQQLRLLFSPDVPENLKRRYLLKDLLARDIEFSVFINCGYVTFKDQIDMAKDKPLQKYFRKILNRIKYYRTKAEEETLLNRLMCMNPKTKTGWNFFLTHHWLSVFPEISPSLRKMKMSEAS